MGAPTDWYSAPRQFENDSLSKVYTEVGIGENTLSSKFRWLLRGLSDDQKGR